MDSLTVAIAQMTSVDDVSENYNQIIEILSKLSKTEKVRLVCFPENSLYMRLKEGGTVQPFDLQNEFIGRIADWCKKNKTFVHLGSIPLFENGVLFNSSILVTDLGLIESTYQKMHLFDIQLDQAEPIRESDVFRHGESPRFFTVDGWKIGQTICYDLRFAELFSQYAQQNVDVILVPSAFLVKTGEAHWHVLLRARAIESQCYILASAQAGLHKSARGQRETYGHSLAVDPWGRIIAEIQTSPGVYVVELDRKVISSVRKQIPMQSHRRSSLLKS